MDEVEWNDPVAPDANLCGGEARSVREAGDRQGRRPEQAGSDWRIVFVP